MSSNSIGTNERHRVLTVNVMFVIGKHLHAFCVFCARKLQMGILIALSLHSQPAKTKDEQNNPSINVSDVQLMCTCQVLVNCIG